MQNETIDTLDDELDTTTDGDAEPQSGLRVRTNLKAGAISVAQVAVATAAAPPTVAISTAPVGNSVLNQIMPAPGAVGPKGPGRFEL